MMYDVNDSSILYLFLHITRSEGIYFSYTSDTSMESVCSSI